MRDTILTVAFLAAYFAVTIWLCRGVRMRTKDFCLCGLSIALTLALPLNALKRAVGKERVS